MSSTSSWYNVKCIKEEGVLAFGALEQNNVSTDFRKEGRNRHTRRTFSGFWTTMIKERAREAVVSGENGKYESGFFFPIVVNGTDF
jgi:hypothetical protein